MVEPLSVDTDGVRSLSEIHTGVATGLGSLNAAAPGSAAVATSHGTIAYAVQTALHAALGSRSGTMTATQDSGARISELLQQAAVAYEHGDQRGAAAIKAAADAIADSGPAGAGISGGAGAAGGAAGAAGAAASGTDTVGQVVGQLGQLGQMGQQLGAPLAALGQPLQQLPQQVMQGVQQISQNTAAETSEDSGRTGAGDAEPADGAASGEAPATGTAPVNSGDRTDGDGIRRAT
ncbi:type VII secretion target [Mycolicibacterium sp. OfavD-34-C]|uniref:type VII secretion target n=1 Tax=Mycolicibacterium sp. OfavD-34-C TaxID=2917746 RepID=UPI001EF743B4|nr:type VII secretion target [Mycolicibacterium sp. OfavD-34-C]MCG7582152.1 ESX-1 secretion-associated protein [Mycolicibacterium sp. OfavD-34-C]